jgi:hypothetical protein
VLLLAAPVAMLHSNAFFDEFDYWAGTVMLVVFALGETILFAWVFGMDRGWAELTAGAELRIPRVFFFIIKYVTPVFLLVVLVAYAFKPAADWGPYFEAALGGKSPPAWEWAGDGMLGKLMHRDLDERIAAQRLSEQRDLPAVAAGAAGLPAGQPGQGAFTTAALLVRAHRQELSPEGFRKRIGFLEDLKVVRNINRLVMVGMFTFLSLLVWRAWKRRRAEGRA